MFYKRIGFLFLIAVLAPWVARPLPKNDTAQSVLHIYFKFNSAAVADSNIGKINNYVKPGSTCKIYISGYCDREGSLGYNDGLSLKRVNAVRTILLQNGIDSASIVKTIGYGKRRLCNKNKTAAERQANRRVDIKVVDIHGNFAINALAGLKKVGGHIILKDLDFVGGMHSLLPGFLPGLDTLVRLLELNPSLQIRIIGHICCLENGEDGLDYETMTYNLSTNRAKAVYDYLLQHNINKNRLSYTGMRGKNKLVSPELTEADKTMNRRVEIVIVKY